MTRAALLLACALAFTCAPLRAQEASSGGSLLRWSSVAYLVNASMGAAIAIQQDLPMDFFGIRTGWSASGDFLGPGTALSPGVPMLLSHAALTALSARPDRTGHKATVGLVILGIAETAGAIGEHITQQALLGRQSPERTVVAVGNVVLPALMAYSGIRDLRRR